MFGAAPAAPAAAGGLFGAAPAAIPAAGGLFGATPAAPAAAPAAGGLFGAAPAATPAAGGLFGATPAAPAAAPAAGGLFGAAPAAPAAGGLLGGLSTPGGSAAPAAGSLFGAAPPAAATSTALAAPGFGGAPAAAGALVAATDALGGAPKPPASLPSRLHGKKLLDIMDDFRIKLAEQVNKFTTQALQVDERDRQLIQQRDRALKLDETTRRLKQNATALNAELELVLGRQDEMHAALRELESKVEEEANHFRHLERPSERQQAYQLAEHLDAELGQTREELAECVEQLNAQRQAEAGGQEAHRLAQLVEVMDVHVNALHYLEGQSDKLDATLQQVSLLGGQHAMQRAWMQQ